MGGLRHRAGRVAGVTKAVLAAVLLGGTLTAGFELRVGDAGDGLLGDPVVVQHRRDTSLVVDLWQLVLHHDVVADGWWQRRHQPDRRRRRRRREQHRRSLGTTRTRRPEAPAHRCPGPSPFRPVRASPPSSDAVAVVAARTRAAPHPREARPGPDTRTAGPVVSRERHRQPIRWRCRRRFYGRLRLRKRLVTLCARCWPSAVAVAVAVPPDAPVTAATVATATPGPVRVPAANSEPNAAAPGGAASGQGFGGGGGGCGH